MAPVDHRAPVQSSPLVEDKFKALRAYRRANGLCDICAEKWSKGHTCACSVQLHAMQEMLEHLPTKRLTVSR